MSSEQTSIARLLNGIYIGTKRFLLLTNLSSGKLSWEFHFSYNRVGNRGTLSYLEEKCEHEQQRPFNEKECLHPVGGNGPLIIKGKDKT